MGIKAVLFDLDGVLVDAVKIHDKAFRAALLAKTGIDMSEAEHMSRFNGLPTYAKLDMLIADRKIRPSDFEGIAALKQKITKDLIEHEIEVDPIKTLLFEQLKKRGIKIGCVTNCSRATAEIMLRNSLLYSSLDVLITNEMVLDPKPAPDGYLRAMETIRIEPHDVLIVEDSPKGIEAAKLTGAHVWSVSGPDEVTWINIQKYL